MPSTSGLFDTPEGIQLYYEVSGTGEPVILLHGFGGASLDWTVLAAEWAAKSQVIVADLRGHGRSTNPLGIFRHDAAARDMIALLDHLDVRTFKGVGVSAGGNVLLHLATTQPDRVQAMVLVSSTSHFPDQARPIMRAYSTSLLPAEEMERMRRRHPGGDTQIETLFSQARSFAASYDDLAFTPADLGKIKARTLIIQGDRDPFYPVQISVDMFHAIPKSSLWIVPGGGHGPIGGDRWPDFTKAAAAFLRS